MREVDRLLIDVDDDGLVRASVWLPPVFPEPVAGVRELVWPLDQCTTRWRPHSGWGKPFRIVHFDGHGVLDGHDRGLLVFEGPHGGPDRVPAERVAGVLGMFKVPVVVLNACQSGAVGKQVEAAVATRLLAGGAASVVAMAYSVYAVAAVEFMTAFYEELFAGGSVAEAVAQGRARMVRNPRRPSH